MEILQNAEDHSGSAIGAVFCGRYLRNKGKVRVGIVDVGDGIHTTLRREHTDTLNAAMALRRVVAGGYSAKSRKNNMGVGISNLWAIVTQQLRGHIFIVTEDGFAYNDCARLKSENVGFHFPGTGVFFTLPAVDEGKLIK
jgi:hypothetical protein